MFATRIEQDMPGIGRPEVAGRVDFSDRLQDVGRELCEAEEMLLNVIQMIDGSRPDKAKVESPANHYEAVQTLRYLSVNVRSLSCVLYDLLK